MSRCLTIPPDSPDRPAPPPTACPAGSFQTLPGQSGCLPVPAGGYTPAPGATEGGALPPVATALPRRRHRALTPRRGVWSRKPERPHPNHAPRARRSTRRDRRRVCPNQWRAHRVPGVGHRRALVRAGHQRLLRGRGGGRHPDQLSAGQVPVRRRATGVPVGVRRPLRGHCRFLDGVLLFAGTIHCCLGCDRVFGRPTGVLRGPHRPGSASRVRTRELQRSSGAILLFTRAGRHYVATVAATVQRRHRSAPSCPSRERRLQRRPQGGPPRRRRAVHLPPLVCAPTTSRLRRPSNVTSTWWASTLWPSHQDLLDHRVVVGHDAMFHLHRLEHHQGLTCRHRVSRGHLDGRDCARHRRHRSPVGGLFRVTFGGRHDGERGFRRGH